MGGKSFEAGQHLYFCVALLSLLGGCGILKDRPEPPVPPPAEVVLPEPPPVFTAPEIIVEPRGTRQHQEADEHLKLAQNFLAKGDYDASLRESRRVIVLARDQAPGDAAVFNMGLVFASPKNPKRDNKRAMGFFNQVIRSYPESLWAEQAKIWIGVLDGVEKLKQVDIEIEEKKRDRSR